MATFITAQKLITGAGTLVDCGTESARFGKSCLLVTGRSSLRKAGITDRLMDLLAEHSIAAHVFDGVNAEPTLHMLDEGRKLVHDLNADFVIGAGGGSAMDAGKVIAGLANEEAPSIEFHEGKKVEKLGIPFIAIPTTSGTGSEVTKNGVITNGAAQVKKSIRDDGFMAKVVILDPELTIPVPPDITANTGMDALTQAIESYTSIHATPITEALSIKAISLICRSLPVVCKNGNNIDARTDMAYGSLMAGMALANARLGAVHGLAHPLGVRYGIPHGLVCGVLLPRVMRLNAEAAGEKYAKIARMVKKDAIEFVEELSDKVGLPKNLREFDISREAFDAIIEESMPSGSLKANPKPITEDDLRTILEEIT
ncbi:MAG: iron-containing alcohol dehydrogenase [Planctomycetes bacterium]|nr:iron-containing alcohol dehydrogenase [Planctomycetota bacterium]